MSVNNLVKNALIRCDRCGQLILGDNGDPDDDMPWCDDCIDWIDSMCAAIDRGDIPTYPIETLWDTAHP